MENHILVCLLYPRSRLELLFFIQVGDDVCRLYLRTKMNESDNIITYQEVLRDVTFP